MEANGDDKKKDSKSKANSNSRISHDINQLPDNKYIDLIKKLNKMQNKSNNKIKINHLKPVSNMEIKNKHTKIIKGNDESDKKEFSIKEKIQKKVENFYKEELNVGKENRGVLINNYDDNDNKNKINEAILNQNENFYKFDNEEKEGLKEDSNIEIIKKHLSKDYDNQNDIHRERIKKQIEYDNSYPFDSEESENSRNFTST